ncbi:MAG: hypothetical protein ACFFDP_07715 [Promethearchaeota archaeon]
MLGSRAFFSSFITKFEHDESKRSWLDIPDGEWTNRMLGTAKSRKKKDFGLIGSIGQELGYIIQSEWMRIDQVWYIILPKPKGWKRDPWRTEVAIEHENHPSIGYFEYTLHKLEELAVPLKIAFFYPGDQAEEWLHRAEVIIPKQIKGVLGGVYLLVFGFLNEEETGHRWEAYEIDTKGTTIALH